MVFDDINIVAIIPGAGSGERLKSDLNPVPQPKQFIEISGYPVLYHTIKGFLDLIYVNKIIVSIQDEHKQLFNDTILKLFNKDDIAKVDMVSGGHTRHRSIANGVRYFDNSPKKPDIVIIHDAVRPFIVGNEPIRLYRIKNDHIKNLGPADHLIRQHDNFLPDHHSILIHELIENAIKFGAVGPVCNLTSTILSVTDDGFLNETLERKKYRSSEMPQVFKYAIIKDAYDKCSEYDYDHGTECLDLAMKYGGARIKFIEGDPGLLWKITYFKDLFASEAMVKMHQRLLIFYSLKDSTYLNNFIDFLNKDFSVKLKFDLVEESKYFNLVQNYPNDNDVLIFFYIFDSLKQVIDDIVKVDENLTSKSVHILIPSAVTPLDLKLVFGQLSPVNSIIIILTVPIFDLNVEIKQTDLDNTKEKLINLCDHIFWKTNEELDGQILII